MATKKAASTAAPSGLDLNAIAKKLEPAVRKQLGPDADAQVGTPSLKSILNLILVVLQAIMDSNLFDQMARSKGYVMVESKLFDQVAASKGYAKK